MTARLRHFRNCGRKNFQVDNRMFKQKRKILRVVDANRNRACEGLRVVEDFARFVLDDSHLSNQCKQLRHEIVDCTKNAAFTGIVVMREAMADVGRTIETDAEYKRTDPDCIVNANLARVQQATRTLEEYSKALDVAVAKRFEQVRYCAYQLESSFAATMSGQARLSSASLYVLVDAADSDETFRSRIANLVATSGDASSAVDVVQLRDKQASTRVLIDRCRAFREISVGTNTLLIVNDRPDVAAVVQADGVHLGQADMSIHEARSVVGPGMLIGISTHSVAQVESAVTSGANYIGVGPTFASKTKSFNEFTGIDLLRSVADLTSLPAFAIGGIDPTNIDQVLEAGICRVAVSAAVWQSADPGHAARQLRAKLSQQHMVVGSEK